VLGTHSFRFNMLVPGSYPARWTSVFVSFILACIILTANKSIARHVFVSTNPGSNGDLAYKIEHATAVRGPVGRAGDMGGRRSASANMYRSGVDRLCRLWSAEVDRPQPRQTDLADVGLECSPCSLGLIPRFRMSVMLRHFFAFNAIYSPTSNRNARKRSIFRRDVRNTRSSRRFITQRALVSLSFTSH
jgi:hypothetical protein